MLKKLSFITGLTPVEIKVLVFAVLMLLTGIIYKSAGSIGGNDKIYSYESADSLFAYYAGRDSLTENYSKIKNLIVDYKQEVLDFNNKNFNFHKKAPIPKENSVDINAATAEELTAIPGIGVKTAEKIIKLRESKGYISYEDALLEVKGIGKKKLSAIKKYIFVKK